MMDEHDTSHIVQFDFRFKFRRQMQNHGWKNLGFWENLGRFFFDFNIQIRPDINLHPGRTYYTPFPPGVFYKLYQNSQITIEI